MATITRIDPQAFQQVGKRRVAAYCRVSSNSADQLNSYARQIRVYTDLITSRSDWSLVEVFADEGITGTSAKKRPDFLRMIRMCELKQIDLIITKSVSRFARNVKEALAYIRKLKVLGVSVMFEKEGINTQSMADEMLLNTFSALAQEESMAISQNLKLANRKRMEDGDYINASVPYGFTRLKGRIVPYAPEAEIVRLIFSLYLSGCSTAAIARELDRRGIPTRNGLHHWKATRIGYILANEKYVGVSLFQKSYTTEFPFKRKKNRGEEDMFFSENTHDPIISREEYDAVQRLLDQRREKSARKTEITDYPFTGKMRCAECGALIRRHVVRGRERWCCAVHIENSSKCSAHYVQTEKIESGFITMVNNLRFGSDVLAATENALVRAIQRYRVHDEGSREISKELADLNGQLLMLEQLYGKNYIPIDVYQAKSREIAARVEELKASKSITSGAKLDEALKNVRQLKEYIEEIEDPISTFDADLFGKIVLSGSLSASDLLTLDFIGGIQFTEHI